MNDTRTAPVCHAPGLTPRIIIHAARRGDRRAQRLLHRVGAAARRGDPRAVALCGRLTRYIARHPVVPIRPTMRRGVIHVSMVTRRPAQRARAPRLAARRVTAAARATSPPSDGDGDGPAIAALDDALDVLDRVVARLRDRHEPAASLAWCGCLHLRQQTHVLRWRGPRVDTEHAERIRRGATAMLIAVAIGGVFGVAERVVRAEHELRAAMQMKTPRPVVRPRRRRNGDRKAKQT